MGCGTVRVSADRCASCPAAERRCVVWNTPLWTRRLWATSGCDEGGMLGGTLWGAAQLDWFRAGAGLTRTGKMGLMQEIAINY